MTLALSPVVVLNDDCRRMDVSLHNNDMSVDQNHKLRSDEIGHWFLRHREREYVNVPWRDREATAKRA